MNLLIKLKQFKFVCTSLCVITPPLANGAMPLFQCANYSETPVVKNVTEKCPIGLKAQLSNSE